MYQDKMMQSDNSWIATPAEADWPKIDTTFWTRLSGLLDF